MNIQINLLPEARLTKLRNTSRKRTFGAIAGATVGIFVASSVLFIMLLGFLLATYNINQSKISTLNKSLESSKTLEEDASTLQANLAAFYKQNSNRTYASRIFTNLNKITPANITLTNLQIDNKGLVTVSGSTSSYADVSRFGETLSQYNVNYLPQEGLDRLPIFSDITITSVTKDNTSGKTNFSMTFKVDNNLIKKQKQ